MNSRPHFKHDCSCCSHLGGSRINGSWVDYYQCGSSYVARFGHKPEDNRSLPINIVRMISHSDEVWRRLVSEVIR